MTEQDLDLAYSSICRSMMAVGETNAPLFLATLCLSLMTRADDLDAVLPLIAQAERLAST